MRSIDRIAIASRLDARMRRQCDGCDDAKRDNPMMLTDASRSVLAACMAIYGRAQPRLCVNSDRMTE
jgi:hypothetical protein